MPGHGPVTDKSAVAEVRDYLAFVDEAASARQAAGIDAWEAARDIAREIGANPEFQRVGRGRAHRGQRRHRATAPSIRRTAAPNVVEQFRRMAELEGGAPT